MIRRSREVSYAQVADMATRRSLFSRHDVISPNQDLRFDVADPAKRTFMLTALDD